MKQKKSIVLVGGGGHCKSCIDVIEQEGKFEIAGIIDLPEKIGEKVLDYDIIGSDENLTKITKKYSNFLITIGHIGTSSKRIRIFDLLKSLNAELPVIKSPLAYVSEHAEIEQGSIIMHQAIVNAGARIGKNCIINTKALIEHDVQIEDNNHISTGAIINGDCKVESNCLIGSGVVLKHTTKICPNTIIGAGTVVTKDIIDSDIYIGNPAKKLN